MKPDNMSQPSHRISHHMQEPPTQGRIRDALSWWAERDVTEGDAYSVRTVKHKPFDGAGVWK